jgi:flagellar motor component MotA
MEQKETIDFLNSLIELTEKMSPEDLLKLEEEQGVNHEEIQQYYLNSEIKIVDSVNDLFYVDSRSVREFISEIQVEVEMPTYSYDSKSLGRLWKGNTHVLKQINFA